MIGSTNYLNKIFTTLMTTLALALTLMVIGQQPAAAQTVRQAAGPTPADIQAAVDAFRADLGGGNNGVGGGPFTTGRREINWDAVPDARSAPNNLPFDFFNAVSKRGAVFATDGASNSFQVSANAVNPANAAVEFGNINPAYTGLFRTFSAQRLFTALESNVSDVFFFVPGTSTPALVNGFGAVFTDVELAGSSKIEYYDAAGNLLYSGNVQPVAVAHETLSFLGVSFATPVVAWVRITSGNVALSATAVNSDGKDVAALDDFIYGEPQAGPTTCSALTCFTAPLQWRLQLKRGGLAFDGLIRVPGASQTDTANVNSFAVRHALEVSPFDTGLRDDLLAEYVAAQLSVAARPNRVGLLNGQLNCYGANNPATLSDGTPLNSFSTIGQLFNATNAALEENRTDDIVKLLPLYTQLRARCIQ